MTYYVEHRRTVLRAHPITYRTLEDIYGRTGFQSVYAVDEAVARACCAANSAEGLDSAIVYSDTLFIDVDNDDAVFPVEMALAQQKALYCRCATGGRGAHFHVDINSMRGNLVPQSQLAWLMELLGEHYADMIDTSIYRHGSIYRLIGTWHEKHPGHCKHITYESTGSTVIIPVLEALPASMVKQKKIDTSPGDRNQAEFWASIMVSKTSPGRNQRVFALGCLAAECGVEYQVGLDAVQHWAETKAVPPMNSGREIERQYSNGYRTV